MVTTTQLDTGDPAELRRRLTWLLHTAQAASQRLEPCEPQLPLDPPGADVRPLRFADYDAARRWYETDHAALAAAPQAAAGAGFDTLAWQLAVVLRGIYLNRTPIKDWTATSLVGLEAARRDGNQAAEADLHDSLGMAYTQAGHGEQAAGHYHAALAIRRAIGDRFGEALTLNGLGLLALRRRQLQDARDDLRRGTLLLSDRDHYWAALVGANLADALLALGDLTEAEDLIRHALDVFDDHGEPGTHGNALRLLSAIRREAGHPEEAIDAAQRAVDMAVTQENLTDEGFRLIELGHAQRAVGRPGEALTSYHRSATLHRRLGDHAREAEATDSTGTAYRELNRPNDAAQFHRAAARTYRTLDDHWGLALALDHLALALHDTGATDEAQQRWREALTLLTAYDDPHAHRERARIRQTLETL